MLGHRQLTLEDYVDILKRRFRLILISAAALFAVGIGLSHVIPPQYVSQTLILIEQQKVPEDYVKPVVVEDLGARLASMKEQILSRSRIEAIINKYNLFSDGKTNMDDRVELTQKAITISPIAATGTSHGMPGFFITYKAQNARTAQQICGEITSLFVTDDLSSRQESAEGTTEFLKQQLADSKKNLDDQDAKLAVFQQKYFGQLPDQETSNTNTLQALVTQLDAVSQSLSRDQQAVTLLQAMVAQQTHDLQELQPAGSSAAVSDERSKELQDLIDQKQKLEAQYTPDHPDVVAISRKIADLQAEIASSSAAPASAPGPAPAPGPAARVVSRPDPPQLVQLKTQLRAAQESMAGEKQEQAQIQQQVRTYEARIESTPKVAAEFKQLTRDHQTAVDFYNSLLTKMNESSMATALEQHQQGEQFRVMDPPNLPDAPKFPNPYVFAGGGLFAGLCLGVLLAGLAEYRDPSLRNDKDIWAFTKLPTLGMISDIEGLPQRTAPPRRSKLFSRAAKPIESTLG